MHDLSDLAEPRLVDGIVLTKFDTIDDKVGAALSMVYCTGKPIVFVGTGQKYTNLKRLNVKDVVNLLSKAGTDIAPKNIKKQKGKLLLDKECVEVASIDSKASIRALKFVLPLDKAIDLERIRLRVTWDGREQASIDAPLCLFFGAGTFYNREKKEYLVKGFPINVRFDYAGNRVELGCYYPMPFFQSATIELYDIVPSDVHIEYEVRYEPLRWEPNQASYFHATYQDIPKPEAGKDLQLLDTKGIEGQDDWSGSFVGTSLIFTHEGNLGTLEGDPRFFFDDSQTPQAAFCLPTARTE